MSARSMTALAALLATLQPSKPTVSRAILRLPTA